jgi:hypothetical protein
MKTPSPEELAATAAEKLEVARVQLVSLLATVDARYLLATYSRLLIEAEASEKPSEFFRPAPVAVELAAFLLIPFFDGGKSREPQLIQECIDALEGYQKAHTFAEAFQRWDRDEETRTVSLQWSVNLHASTVRGTAYPIQVWTRIHALFGPFEDELRARFGVGPLRAAEIVRALLFQMEDNINSTRDELSALLEKGVRLKEAADEGALDRLREEFDASFEGMGDKWVPSFSQIAARVDGLTSHEWNDLFECIGLTPENRSTVTNPVDVQDHPLILVHPDRAFTAQGTAALDAIFHFFDKQVRADSELTAAYVRENASWMENRIGEFLTRVFPKHSVLVNACYPNPDQPGLETEADAIVLWGPILVLVEAKGATVDHQGFRRSPKVLRKLLRKNVQDGFRQTERVIRALEKDEEVIFKEKATGRTVAVNRSSLRKLMPVSVTLQHLMGVPTQLAATQQLGLFKKGTFPWSVSIDDLDVITRFAGTADVFLHYIERRIAHQSCKVEMLADELDLFAHYLDNRLHPSIYENRPEILEHEGFNSITINGGEERFDPFYSAEWYGHKQPREIPKLSIPDGILSLLRELRERQDDGARYIAFALLGLSSEALSRIAANIDQVRAIGRPKRQITRTTFSEDGVTVNVMAHASLSEKVFFQNVLVRSRIEHYRTRSKQSVSIGIDLRESRTFQIAQWMEGEWRQEPEMEKVLEEDRTSERSMNFPKGSPKLSRNSPCPCRSGKKFKKCCLGRLEVRR